MKRAVINPIIKNDIIRENYSYKIYQYNIDSQIIYESRTIHFEIPFELIDKFKCKKHQIYKNKNNA